VADVDSNNENAINRLLKIGDNIPIHRDSNSAINVLLSQINPQMYGNNTLMQSLDSHFILRNEQVHLYLQQLSDIDVLNRNTYTLEDGLYIGRKLLGPIATKFNKVIICFETGKCGVDKNLIRGAPVFFPDVKHHFYIRDIAFKHLFKQYHYTVNDAKYANTVQLPLITSL
jgi:hypothetical protein